MFFYYLSAVTNIYQLNARALSPSSPVNSCTTIVVQKEQQEFNVSI